MDIKNILMDYINEIGKIPRNEIDESLPIYSSVILSSLKIIELMVFIEKQFNIMIKPEEFIESNFKDISSIIKFIESKI